MKVSRKDFQINYNEIFLETCKAKVVLKVLVVVSISVKSVIAS